MKTDEISYWQYNRVDAEREVTGNSFSNGIITYKQFLSTSSKINLYRSYVKLTLTISNAAGNADITLKDNIAPNFLACESLFKSCYYKINNVPISSIGDHVQSISVINQRRNNSRGFRDSVLKDMNFGKPEFSERQKTMMTLNQNGGEICEERVKTGTDASTLAVTVAGQVDGVGIVLGDIALGDIIEVYDAATGLVLEWRGIIQRIDNANQYQASSRPAIVVPASTNWVRIRKKNNHRGARTIELIFRPCLGVFQADNWMLGHDYELCFFPHASLLWKKFFIQSLVRDKVPEVDYDITVDNMIFYPCIGHIERSVASAEYNFSFNETRLQIRNITSNTDIDRTFVIDKRSKYIIFALRDARAEGGNTLFPKSLFKVGQNSVGIDTDLDLKSYVLLIDKYQMPQPTHDQETNATTDRMAQSYYENLNYSNQMAYLSDMESQSEFKKLGAYYLYKVPHRESRSNPKISLKTTFRSPFSADAKPNILLFDVFERSYKLIAKNGRIVEVIPTPHGQ